MVFTVDYTDRKIRVAMVEGRVAVVSANPSIQKSSDKGRRVPNRSELHVERAAIELAAGEELKVTRDGHSTLVPEADLEAATAWRQGKVVLRSDRLDEAVLRMNRYSHVQLEIEESALAAELVSGVFET